MIVFYERAIFRNFFNKEVVLDSFNGDMIGCAKFINDYINKSLVEFIKLGLGDSDFMFKTFIMYSEDIDVVETITLEYKKEKEQIIKTLTFHYLN